jgi:hypothetical protein
MKADGAYVRMKEPKDNQVDIDKIGYTLRYIVG